VTRLCNSLQVIWPAVQGEIDWTDLVVLETLRLRERGAYNLILEKLDLLTGEPPTVGDDKEWAKAFVPIANNSSNPEVAKDALMYLFPRLAKALGNNTFDYRGTDQDAARNRRLQCAEYARNYFALAPAADQFTAADIKNLFATSDPKAAFDKLGGRARSLTLLKALRFSAPIILVEDHPLVEQNIKRTDHIWISTNIIARTIKHAPKRSGLRLRQRMSRPNCHRVGGPCRSLRLG
jgi:hypothetical protein